MTSHKITARDSASVEKVSRLSLPYLSLFIGLFIVFAFIFSTQDLSDVHTASIRPEGDGLYYYVYLRSLIFDGDVDFANDYKLLGNQFRLKKSKEGKAGNIFTIGPAIYWMPFAAIAHAIVATGRFPGHIDHPRNGKSALYQRIVQFGSLFWGFAGLFLVIRFLRPQYGDKIAVITVFGLALATPLGWYMLRQAAYSHAICAFSIAAFVYYWHGTLNGRNWWQWGVLGLLIGLGMLVRPQNVSHAILPFGEWLMLAFGALYNRRYRDVGKLVVFGLVFVGAAFIAFIPQMIAWNSIYGSYFTIPQEHGGAHFMFWAHSKWPEVLFSSRHGLFAWNPIIYCGVIGLIVIGIRGDKGLARFRFVPILMLLAIAIQVYINGAVKDWFGGWAFGGRRFMSCTIYFGFGIAVMLSQVAVLAKRLSPWLVAASPAIAVAVFAAFNISLMDDYRYSRAKHAASQEMKPIWQRAIAEGVDSLYGVVGNLGSIPDNWIFAVRAGVSPERYDAVSGYELFDRRRKAILKFTDKRFALKGFGKVESRDGQLYSWVRSKIAVFVMPLRKPHELEGSVKLMPERPGTKLQMKIGTDTIFREELRKGWQSYPVHIHESTLEAGFNYVTVFINSLEQEEKRGKTLERTVHGVAFDSMTLLKVKP